MSADEADIASKAEFLGGRAEEVRWPAWADKRTYGGALRVQDRDSKVGLHGEYP